MILNGEMLEAIQLKLEMRQGCPLCQILLYIVPKLLAEAINQEKETEGRQIRKQLKLSLFAKDMGIYMTVSIESTRKLSDLYNTFKKLTSYKISILKSEASLYTKDKPTKKEIRQRT